MEPSSWGGRFQIQDFTTSPILKHPDTSRPFKIVVDDSESRIETVLSQHFGEKPKLHPITFYSKTLSFAEQNNDLMNHELWAVKLALEE